MRAFLLATAATAALVSASPVPVLLDNESMSARENTYFKPVKEPKHFTSAFSTRAVNTTIINNDQQPVPGQPGAFGHFQFRLNSDKDTICWNIRLVGVTGEYQSPAVTATHIHQAPVGRAGPPRLAFPNPTFVRNDTNGVEIRESIGCAQGPFRTGVAPNGTDTGSASGFTLKTLEQDGGSGFFADTHTRAFPAGAVRGQLLASEVAVKPPKRFDAILRVNALPENVVSPTNQTGVGQQGARAAYDIKINVEENTICYGIDLFNAADFENGGRYFSPAKTATHIHQAAAGANGPPRIALYNPKPQPDGIRRSGDCIKGPFTTGILNNGTDTGSNSGFTLQQIVDNPSGFFADTHNEANQAGIVRGQIERV